MSPRHLISILAALCLLPACAEADTPAPEPGFGSGFGTLSAALGFDGPIHDVVGVHVKVVAAGEDCDADAIAEKTVSLEDEFLPIHLELLPPGGTAHPFSDALFVLPPGDYHVCATPVTETGEPSTHCGMTESDATVVAEETTEILLYAQCLGDPTGALDVIVALNDPPHIDDLVYDGSKFITLCETVAITVSASDPNGDQIFYQWALVDGPGPTFGFFAAEDGSILVWGGGAPGTYQLIVIANDGHGGTAELTVPVHISDADCGWEGDCCAPNGTPGCDDVGLSNCACLIAPECCASGWTEECFEAVNICAGGPFCPVPPACVDAGNCTVACGQEPGADVQACIGQCIQGLEGAELDLFNGVLACGAAACPDLAVDCLLAAIQPDGACAAETAACVEGAP